MSEQFIDAELKRLQAELEGSGRKLDEMLVRLDAIRGEVDAATRQRDVLAAQVDLLSRMIHADAGAVARSEQRASSSGSKRWHPVIMEAVRRHPRPLRIHEVQGIQQGAGVEPATMNNVRSHFFNNSKPGRFYERIGTGEYRATQVAATALGVALGSSTKNEDGPAPAEPSE
jgi:hypothetical protein